MSSRRGIWIIRTICLAVALIVTAPLASGVQAAQEYSGLTATDPSGYLASPGAISLQPGGSAVLTFTTSFTNTTAQTQSAPLYFSVWHLISCTGGTPAFLEQCGGGSVPIDVSTGGGSITQSTFVADRNWTFTDETRVYPTAAPAVPPDCAVIGASVLITPVTGPACVLTLPANTSDPVSVTFVTTVSSPGYYRMTLGSCQTPGNDPTGCIPPPPAPPTPSPTPCFQPQTVSSAHVCGPNQDRVAVLPLVTAATGLAHVMPAAIPTPTIPTPQPTGNVLPVTATSTPAPTQTQTPTSTPTGVVEAVSVPFTGTPMRSPLGGIVLVLAGVVGLGTVCWRPKRPTE